MFVSLLLLQLCSDCLMQYLTTTSDIHGLRAGNLRPPYRRHVSARSVAARKFDHVTGFKQHFVEDKTSRQLLGIAGIEVEVVILYCDSDSNNFP